MSYWWSQITRKPDAKQSQEFWFVAGDNVFFTYATNHVIINAGAVSNSASPLTLTGDATGTGTNTVVVTVTNLQQVLITNKVHWTNSVSLTNSQFQTVNMTIKEGDFETNAAFAFLGLTERSHTNYQSVVITVHNTTGSAVAITAPPNTYTNGVLPYLVTNISKVLIEYHPEFHYTNMLVYPLF